MAKHVDTIPIEVMILTVDHDIKGTVHVSKYTNTNRELTDLLNDKERRFLAVTNVEIYYSTSEFINFGHQSIQELTVMRNNNHRSIKFLDSFFQYIL